MSEEKIDLTIYEESSDFDLNKQIYKNFKIINDTIKNNIERPSYKKNMSDKEFANFLETVKKDFNDYIIQNLENKKLWRGTVGYIFNSFYSFNSYYFNPEKIRLISTKIVNHPNFSVIIFRPLFLNIELKNFVNIINGEKINNSLDTEIFYIATFFREELLKEYDIAKDINTDPKILRELLFSEDQKVSFLALLNPNLSKRSLDDFWNCLIEDDFTIKNIEAEFPKVNIRKIVKEYNIPLLFKLTNFSSSIISSIYQDLLEVKSTVKEWKELINILVENPHTPYSVLDHIIKIKRVEIYNVNKDGEKELIDKIAHHPNYTMENYVEEFINS